MTHKGKLIAVDGLYGSGKSTHLDIAKRWLEQTSIKLFFSKSNFPVSFIKIAPQVKNLKFLISDTFTLLPINHADCERLDDGRIIPDWLLSGLI
jgi:ABC-type lipoprotein export system ATPase subunit